MKPLRTPLLLAITLMIITLTSCEWFSPKIRLSGKVVSITGDPIISAEVQINNKTTKTDKDGTFKLSWKSQDKYEFLVTVRKKGFGLFSKKYFSPIQNEKIRLTQGVIITFDPTTDVVLKDTMISKNFSQSGLLAMDTSKLFDLVPRVYDTNGKLIDLGYPIAIENVLDYLKQPTEAPQGISVSIDANSFEDNDGNPPPGLLKASISTVDFFNPDGMPGDFMIRDENRISSMESYGAGTIEIYDDKKSYRLKKGASALLSVPVYPIRKQLKEIIPQKTDILYYNEQTGYWERSGGKVNYNPTTNSFESRVSHFSVVNIDVVFTGNSGCLKFRQMTNDVKYLSSYKVHVIVPPWAPYAFKEKVDQPVDEMVGSFTGCVRHSVASGKFTSLHPVVRLPYDDNSDPTKAPYVVLIFSGDHDNNAGTADQPIDIAIQFMTSATIDPTPFLSGSPNCIDGSDKSDCVACGDGTPSTLVGDPCNTCWQANCSFLPFQREPATCEAVAYSGYSSVPKAKVKWTIDTITYPGIEEFWVMECSGPNCPTTCNGDAQSCDVETPPATAKFAKVTNTGNALVWETEFTYAAGDVGSKKKFLIEGLDVTGASINNRIVKICTAEITIAIQ